MCVLCRICAINDLTSWLLASLHSPMTSHGYCAVVDAIIHAYGMVGKARGLYLSTSHHIKPETLGECLMWWRVLRSAHLAVPNDAVCIFSFNTYLNRQNQTEQWSVLESERWANLTIRLVVKTNSMCTEICVYTAHIIRELSNYMHMLCLNYFNPYSAGMDFSRQNLKSVDVRFQRLKSIPTL